MFRLLTTTATLLACLTAAVFADDVSPERLRAHTEYLASDALEGRAPGSRGERLTLEYLEKEFVTYGFGPGAPGGAFRQQVPLVALTVNNAPSLVLSDNDGNETARYRYGSEFMGWTLRQSPSAAVENAELVFVGYGVVAPEYGWDDYKDVDVAGKMIVMLVNDPPLPDPSLFGGAAMTYYGRWTYKFEIAAARGAAGAILIHDTDGAGYGWSVVENSWTGEQFAIARDDKDIGRCAVESWVTGDVAREIFEAAGRTLEEACQQATRREFRPYGLGLRASVHVESDIRRLESNNFIAALAADGPGGGAASLENECVVFNAHWDHLGVGKPVEGDSIYNGALDNASGVAGMLEIARLFGEHADELKRTVLFLIPTAEESGLLGAYYYADHPSIPLTRTAAMINVDGLNVWGPTHDMVVVGYGQSDLDAILEGVLAAVGRTVSPDAEPEKGFYYRSDHFAFARKGVPALYADSGVEAIDRPQGWGMQRRKEYNTERYHTPNDEYLASWDFAGAAEDMMALYRVGLKLATTDRWPQWSQSSEFRAVREESLQGGK